MSPLESAVGRGWVCVVVCYRPPQVTGRMEGNFTGLAGVLFLLELPAWLLLLLLCTHTHTIGYSLSVGL